MKINYVLLIRFERELDIPIPFETLAEARRVMKESLISVMSGTDDSIFDDYVKDEDYDWESNGNCAWFNYRHGNSDWRIIEINELAQSLLTYKKGASNDNVLDAPEPDTLILAFSVDITQENIDEIMCTALEGGITHWCSSAEVVGDYHATYAHEQISRGGKIILHDAEDDKQYELTKEKFINGLRLFLNDGHLDFVDTNDNSVDPCDFDAEYADVVVQLALFGEIVFS